MGRASTHTMTDRDKAYRGRAAPPVRVDSSDRSPVAVNTADAQSVLGNRSARMLLAQPKLTVGTTYDPLEIEADRVAADVVRTISAGPVPAPTAPAAPTDLVGPLGPDAHECGAECSIHRSADIGGRPDVVLTVRRVADLDSPPIGADGGEIRAADEAAVNRARGGGAPLPADFRARVEPVMGADFSGVRVHTGAGATQLNRSFGASAFTIGNDIFFRDGMPDMSSQEGTHLISHELTHTIQQGGAATVARCCGGRGDEHIQRHSSFEHLMLGNVDPRNLAKIGAWQDAIEQTVPSRTGVSKKVRGSGGGKKVAQVDVDLGGGQQLQISKTDILHVLVQEMLRLKQWQRDPPKESSAEQAEKGGDQTLAPIGKDPTYDVYTIMLPQGIMCTYGEMNTLGDYFGSVEVLRTATPKHVWQLLQSVRDETWGFLSTTYDKVVESLTKEEQTNNPALDNLMDTVRDEIILPALVGEDSGFQGAMAARVSGMAGQIELLTGIQGTGAVGETNKYTPSLGRNACHFVPESWNAWAANHKKAREVALKSKQAEDRSKQARQRAAAAGDDQARMAEQDTFDKEKAKSSQLANEALMTNGFGDHYLQDSYAAGHMINKTQIMQFYIEYIDKNNQWDYFKDANWRKVQNMAYGQIFAPVQQYDETRVEGYNGATGAAANKAIDPQSVENRSNESRQAGNRPDWKTNFTELGLQVPRSLSNDPMSATRKILNSMRGQARGGTMKLKGDAIINLMKGDFNATQVRLAVADMLLDGVLLSDVDVSKRGRQMADMRDSRSAADAKGAAAQPYEGAGEELEMKKFRSGTYELRPELKPKEGDIPNTARSEANRQEEYSAIVYNDYLEFIQSSFLQKSTNALHDTFCKGGLKVWAGNGDEIGTVYGDDNMFNANSSVGVAHSGVTSQMSRDAIVNIINNGDDGGKTVQAIVDRFPREVRADVYNSKGKVTHAGIAMSIEDWHNTRNDAGLRKTAFDKLFPTMNWSVTQKMAPGAKADLGTFFTVRPPHVPF